MRLAKQERPSALVKLRTHRPRRQEQTAHHEGEAGQPHEKIRECAPPDETQQISQSEHRGHDPRQEQRAEFLGQSRIHKVHDLFEGGDEHLFERQRL